MVQEKKEIEGSPFVFLEYQILFIESPNGMGRAVPSESHLDDRMRIENTSLAKIFESDDPIDVSRTFIMSIEVSNMLDQTCPTKIGGMSKIIRTSEVLPKSHWSRESADNIQHLTVIG